MCQSAVLCGNGLKSKIQMTNSVSRMTDLVFKGKKNLGNGEKAAFKHYLFFFLQCFQSVFAIKTLDYSVKSFTLSQTSPGFYVSVNEVF